MKKMIYSRLALTNIKKNARFYLPYMLTGAGAVMMFYLMYFLAANPGLEKMPGAVSIISMMNLGTGIIGIFSAIFLFYTNSFLIKRRKKEFGLYNILGMEKRHIEKTLFFENLYVMAATIGGGLICGIIFSRLMCMLLLKIINIPASIRFQVSGKVVVTTILLFAGIFFLILITNFARIHLADPIALLRGGNVGEKEPKTKLLLAVAGFAGIGIGYYIALTTESPLDALVLFFLAVLLVILGTYCLFTAGSIVILKGLRKNKAFYYKTSHFTSISGMIYRMKQNAAGLANICILSTMVLVMVSGTVSLYLGIEDALVHRYPYDISMRNFYTPEELPEKEEVLEKVKEVVKKQGRKIEKLNTQTEFSIIANFDGEAFHLDTENYSGIKGASILYFYTAEEYDRITGNKTSLSDDGVLLFSNSVKGLESVKSFELLGKTYQVKGEAAKFATDDDFLQYDMDVFYIIVADDAVRNDIYDAQQEVFGDMASHLRVYINLDVDGNKEDKIKLANKLVHLVTYTECRESMRSQFQAMYGGFLFLGVFLGILFLMATGLIIYYKQISEGYDDKERFEIMQKVGMSRHEVKKTIHSQVLCVFFLPLAVAGLHVAAAFKMITKLLFLLNLVNVQLFIWCTLGTILIFAAVYALIYALTARAYYKIVGAGSGVHE